MTLAPLPEQVLPAYGTRHGGVRSRAHGQADVVETIIVDDGKCVARSYVADRLMAIWFVEEVIVQFYDSDGNLLKQMEPQRAAA